jgi:hypothetical protein
MVWVSLLLSEEDDDRVRNVGEEVTIQSVELVGPLRVVVLHGMDVMFVRVRGFVGKVLLLLAYYLFIEKE